MTWLPLLLLHATPAYLPVRDVARLAICDLDGGSPDAGDLIDGGSPDAGNLVDGGSPDGGDFADGGASGSTGASTTGGSSGSAGTTSGSGSSGDVIGNTSGDNGDSQDFGVPSYCNTSNDCPNLFQCVAHKCQPLPQKNVDAGGCASAPGLGFAAGLVGVALLLFRRRWS